MRKILLGILLGLGIFLGYIAQTTPDYLVAREINIQTNQEVIFNLINQSKACEQWAPWKEVDPQLVMTYSGPEAGVGSQASWDSSGQMGTGSATISESIPSQLVRTQLVYTKPFAMTQEATISLTPHPQGGHTVRWMVKGQRNFLQRLVGCFIPMDDMVGGLFEQGLAKLKVVAEAAH